MNIDVLVAVMAFFAFIAAVALCVLTGLLFGIYKSTKAVQEQAMAVIPQLRSILTKSEATLEESRKHIVDITARASEMSAKATEMMDLGKAQLVKLDSVISDASTRAKIQIERAELVVDDTVSRLHHSVTAVHNGILKPVREVQGVAAGVKAAVQHFVRGNRPSVAQATQDDEMFI